MSWEKDDLEKGFLLIRNGASIKQSDTKKGIPITRIETISAGEIDLNRLGYADINSDKYSDYYLEEGDILMSHINSWSHLGKTALVKNDIDPLIHGMNLLALRADKKILAPSFAKYYFESQRFKSQLGKISNQSVNQASFSISKLKKLQIPLPPLHIQKQIANILGKSDALRKKDQQLLQKYDELAQSIFIDMFGDPVKNEKGWEMGPVRSLATSEKNSIKAGPFGSSLKKEFYVESGYKIYGQEQVIADDFTIGNYYIDEEKFQQLKNCKIKTGDLLISLVGTYGKISIVPKFFEQGIINPRLMKISLNQKLMKPKFFKFLLTTSMVKNYISNFSRGGTMDIVNVGIMSSINVIIPPINLQEKFTDVLNNILKQKRCSIQNHSEQLFQSLLQKAFTGELIHDRFYCKFESINN